MGPEEAAFVIKELVKPNASRQSRLIAYRIAFAP